MLLNICSGDYSRLESALFTVSQVRIVQGFLVQKELLMVSLGDYNLTALDYVDKCGLHWVGNCNELNAGELLVRDLQRSDIVLSKGV